MSLFTSFSLHFVSDFLAEDEDDLTRRQTNRKSHLWAASFFLLLVGNSYCLCLHFLHSRLHKFFLKVFIHHHTWSFSSQKLIEYLMKNTKEFSHKVKFCIKPVSHKEYLPHFGVFRCLKMHLFGVFRPLKRYKVLGA